MPAMHRLFDSHCHLQDERISALSDSIIDRAMKSGVTRMLCCASAESDWQSVAALWRRYPGCIIPAFGLHPRQIASRSPQWLEKLDNLLRSTPSAVGEIGLDFAIDGGDSDDQRHVFTEQLALARRLHRPVSIHCRQAFGALLDIMKNDGRMPAGGAIHSYSGAPDMVPLFEKAGLHISFSGAVTRANHKRARQSAALVSPEKLLIETDSPDIVPAGASGPLNEPANLPLVAEAVAAIRSATTETIAAITTANARHLFSFAD